MQSVTDQVCCSACGRFFKPRTPKGGDGSGNFPARHKFDGETCPGVWEEGKFISAERIQAALDRLIDNIQST